MKINTEKKIFYSVKNLKPKILFRVFFLVSIFILFFGLLTPFTSVSAQSASNPLVIFTDNLNLNKGKTILITAKIYDLSNKTILFQSSPTKGVTFSNEGVCTTGNISYVDSNRKSFCSVYFRSTKIGKFTITASTNFNDILNSTPITITVTEKNVSPACNSKTETLDPITNECVICANPKVIVDGACEKKITTTACESVNRVLNKTTNRCDCISSNIEVDGICKTPESMGSLNKDNKTKTTYTPLAHLPGLPEIIQTNKKINSCPFGNYLNIIIKLIIGIAAVLAMIMIVAGGIEYMTSDLISSKESGKKTITNAILGLVIALSAYLILNTINPKLLNICLDNSLPTVEITISPQQALDIKNRSGEGVCEVVTGLNEACNPNKLSSIFKGKTNAKPPFKTLATQASAICQLESQGDSSVRKPKNTFDKCSDNKPFSFGLFQINAAAHMNDISACNGAFEKTNGTNQGNCVDKQRDPKTGYCTQWDCKTKEPNYTTCQEYLTNPENNIREAYKLYQATTPKWIDWTTYNSCKSKF